MENMLKIIYKFFFYRTQNNFIKLTVSAKSYPGFILFTNVYSTFLSKNLKAVVLDTWDLLNTKTLFIPKFYIRNEYVWQDGFLFDFLQKKTADAWVRRFVIYTGFIFSERLVFDSVVRLYIDNLIWTLHHFSIFELNNVSEMLSSIIYLYITMIFILFALVLL
jgi:hypothetical protein